MNGLETKRISRRSFLKAAAFAGIGSAASIGGSAGYGYWVEPKWIQVERVTVECMGLPEAFDGIRIAQISDLHADTYITPKNVGEAMTLINSLKPDLFVVTGDYVTRESGYIFPIVEELEQSDAALGCFAVPGNHDHLAGIGDIAEAFHRSKIALLRNQSQPIEQDGARIWLAGVDDVFCRKQNLGKALKNIPEGEMVVLLVHEPDYADAVAANGRVTLQLSGHSHGGQIRIPLYGALRLPPLGEKYPWGLNRVGQMQVYTNRGLGMMDYAVRVNCRPEITLLTLKRGKV